MSTKQPKVFIVGDKAEGADFTPTEIDLLVMKVAEWYASPECLRKYPDNKEAAREHIEECLLAQTNKKTTWRNCPDSFAARVKMKCNYDIENDSGIIDKRTLARHQKAERKRVAKKAAKLLRERDAAAAQFDREAFQRAKEYDILSTFPELDNPAHMPNVERLALLYTEQEILKNELNLNPTMGKRIEYWKGLQRVETMIDNTMKVLGIHFEQIRKKVSDRTSGTLADLVAMVEDDAEFREREKNWALTLALQLWWMHEHWNGTKTGPNVHAFEIWHATRSRPMKFTCRCGESFTLVEGFEPHELFEYLVERGVLVEEPVIPGFIEPEELEGLVEHFAQDKEGDAEE